MMSRGFSLLECLIALFIISLLMVSVLKHQVFLLKMQEQITQRNTADILLRNRTLSQSRNNGEA